VREGMKIDPGCRAFLGPVVFEDSREQPGLQMADLLAYEARKVLTDIFKRTNTQPRDQWMQIQRSKLPNGGPRVWPFLWDDFHMRVVLALSGFGANPRNGATQ